MRLTAPMTTWGKWFAAVDPPELRRVIALLLVNLALSIGLTVLILLLRDSVVAYQLAHLRVPPGANLDDARIALRSQVWSRTVGVLVVSVVYASLIRRLAEGRRGAWRRVVLISVAGLLGIVYLIGWGNYPEWMRAEQVAQGLVLAALLYSVTRPAVRAHFARQRAAATPDPA